MNEPIQEEGGQNAVKKASREIQKLPKNIGSFVG